MCFPWKILDVGQGGRGRDGGGVEEVYPLHRLEVKVGKFVSGVL